MRFKSVATLPSLLCVATLLALGFSSQASASLEVYKVRASCGGGQPVGSLYSIRSQILGEQSIFEGRDGRFVGKVAIQRTDDKVRCLLMGRLTVDEKALHMHVSRIACTGENPFSYSFNIPFRRHSANSPTYMNNSMSFCSSGEPLMMTLVKKSQGGI